jgi:hypothetical protein
MEKSLTVTVPQTPNFIKVGTVMLPLTDFSDTELQQIGKMWTEEVIARKHRMSKNLLQEILKSPKV